MKLVRWFKGLTKPGINMENCNMLLILLTLSFLYHALIVYSFMRIDQRCLGLTLGVFLETSAIFLLAFKPAKKQRPMEVVIALIYSFCIVATALPSILNGQVNGFRIGMGMGGIVPLAWGLMAYAPSSIRPLGIRREVLTWKRFIISLLFALISMVVLFLFCL